MNITIYDVAREANVSMATVSRVVNGNPNVKPATRKKVLEVIERLGMSYLKIVMNWKLSFQVQ